VPLRKNEELTKVVKLVSDAVGVSIDGKDIKYIQKRAFKRATSAIHYRISEQNRMKEYHQK